MRCKNHYLETQNCFIDLFYMILVLYAILAGFLGALLGLGGGIIIVPVLTLIYKIPIHQAVAVSLVSIVANSSASASTFVKENLTNVRVGLFLELATITGALVGYTLVKSVEPQIIFLLFGFFLLVSAYLMLMRIRNEQPAQSHPFSEYMGFNSYVTQEEEEQTYKVDRPFQALAWMLVSGVLSSLLGIGGGILKVLAMDHYMRLPIKVSTATSNFMIGVTATAACAAALVHGDIQYQLAAPVAIGIMMGSQLGAKALVKASDQKIRYLFIAVLLFMAFQMIRRGLV